jgi:hypothetical protein
VGSQHRLRVPRGAARREACSSGTAGRLSRAHGRQRPSIERERVRPQLQPFRAQVRRAASTPRAPSKRDLALHAAPDPHSGSEGYTIYSLYWDSPQLRLLLGEARRREVPPQVALPPLRRRSGRVRRDQAAPRSHGAEAPHAHGGRRRAGAVRARRDRQRSARTRPPIRCCSKRW